MVSWRDNPRLGRPAGQGSVDGSEVLADLGDRRPVARLRYVDAEALVVHWVWEHQPGSPRASFLEAGQVQPQLQRLLRALPSPLAGELPEQALQRSLTEGDLLDPVREHALSQSLPPAVLPQWLGLELNALEAAGHRPLLRIQPSPSLAMLPWELMGTMGVERSIDMLDVALLLPASLRNDPDRVVAPWSPAAPVVAVLDPVVPAGRSDLGSVLGPVEPGSTLADWADRLGARTRPHVKTSHEVFHRDDIDRDHLATLLSADERPGRLLYVGHVTSSTHALDARMHLSDGADVSGLAAPVGAHRPLTAADVVVGAPGLAALRSPNRVALIACDSGGDLRFTEPTGLVAAFTHRGAEYVTATRWTLPTAEGLRRFVPALGDRADEMIAEAVIAVDRAHDSADPLAAMGEWQREQRCRWTDTGDPRYSPIIWAAFATAWSPPPARP